MDDLSDEGHPKTTNLCATMAMVEDEVHSLWILFFVGFETFIIGKSINAFLNIFAD